MAVTFKVPKSPKREIAATDSFLGVDLTNSGANIDAYRSPNAPNMVRNVPGKVRKRMGYYKEIQFGRDVNVNFAWGTSAHYKEIFLDSDAVDTWVKVYDTIQELKSKDENDYNLYVEFDYQCPEYFCIMGDSLVVTATGEVDLYDDLAWVHFSGVLECDSADVFTEVDVKTSEAQEIYIKNFSVMRTKDTSYKWSPAPKYFVERETDDPIYGCHFLKNGTSGFDGDRIVNVNRVLDTSSEYKEIDLSETRLVYNTAEIPCPKQTLYVEFDYELENTTQGYDYRLWICNKGVIPLEETHGTPIHVSESFILEFPNGQPYSTRIEILPTNYAYGTFKVKNFSLMYEKDENYTWSPAPEDSKEKFYLKDMYSIESKNYAELESIEKDTSASSTSISDEITICTESSHGGNYQYISFDLSTSILNASATLDNAWCEIARHGLQQYCSIFPKERGKNFKKYHVDLFAYMGSDIAYINCLRFVFNVSGASTKAHISISNLVVKNYTIRDSFEVSSKWFMYHVGKDFYLRAHDTNEFKIVYDNANEHISRSFQMNDKSYIIDGKDIYEFSIEEGQSVLPINQDNAYIPLVTYAKEPSGGGTSQEALNLLQPGFKEQFIGQSGVRDYQLSFDGLDDTEVKAWVRDSNDNWNPKVENTDFTVNREVGKITFNTAPGETPVAGEDSVRIQAYRTVEGYRDRIVKCVNGALFGIGGASNRIFLCGNPEHPNWDFYSQMDDATYFPDLGYSVMGSEQSKIVGYAIVSNYLATFKDGFDQSQSVFIREGDMLVTDEEKKTSEPVFRLINTLQGIGAVAPYSFCYLQTEPLFLTKSGIYAITEQDITGEKYTQNRSFYLDGKLEKEPNMENAMATIYKDQYVLALNGQLYILDGLQATRTDKSEPYATRQYAGFYCDDIPATCLWTDEQICFGTNDGKICRFFSDANALESYNDDGKPIYSCWETGDIDGSLFYKNKTFRYLAVRLMSAIKTSAKMYSRKLGVWNFIREEEVIQNPIDFENLDFDLFTFSVDTSEKVLHTKVRVKKVDKARFRIENDKLNEPFGLFDLALEYIESGNYKG